MENKPIFVVSVVMKKNMIVNAEVQSLSCVTYNIVGDSYVLSGYLKIIINTECLQYLTNWITTAARQQKAKDGNEHLRRASCYLRKI